jgi:hypothetical protein
MSSDTANSEEVNAEKLSQLLMLAWHYHTDKFQQLLAVARAAVPPEEEGEVVLELYTNKYPTEEQIVESAYKFSKFSGH